MADEMPLVRDTIVTEFVPLDAGQTIAEARRKLVQARATYGIVTNTTGVPVALTTAGALAASPDPDAALQAAAMPPTFVVDGEISLDQAVSFSAQTLVEHPEIAGLVVQDHGQVAGVLPRQAIRQRAQHIKTRGGDITELPGVPQTQAKYFVCPKGDYKKLVSQYDPNDPPVCPNDGSILVKE